MNSKTIPNRILRAVAILAAVVITFYFLYKVESVIVYIAVAAVVSLIPRPMVLFFTQRLKFKTTIAAIATMVIMIGLLVGLIGLFIPLIIEQGHNLSLLNIGFYFR